MIKISFFALVALLSAASIHASAPDDAAREKSLRAAIENVLTMSDEDYRDASTSAPAEARWAKLERPALLKVSFKSLAASRRRRAGPVAAGRELDADAKAAGPDADLIQETGWWSEFNAYAHQRQNTTHGVTAVAAVRGGRKLSTGSDKEISRLLAAVDAGDNGLLDEDATESARGRIHLDAARSYELAAGLVGAPAGKLDASRDAALRVSLENALAMSDEDFRDAVKGAPSDAAWAALERRAFLETGFKSLGASRRRLAKSEGLTPAGRDLPSGPNSDLLQQTGWSDSINKYLYTPPPRVRNSVLQDGVFAMRGGRKLSNESDKEVTRLLASVDAGDKDLDAAATPSKRGLIHLAAAESYDKIALIVGASPAAPVPEAPAVKTLSSKEIYQRAAPFVVLILAADKEGAGGELGTGSIIEGGRVLTNAHVVINDKTGRPFSAVRIYLKPERVTGDTKRDLQGPITAKVARFDRALDLAILEPEKRLKAGALALGDDSGVEPGDAVVAIGHPEQGGLWTLTQGVVSTVVADLGGVAGKDAFQTDASINRGNSGGPLIDRSGAIIGVNTSMARKAADGLTITSVNFSVKSSVALRWIGGGVTASAPAAEAPKAEPVDETPKAPVPEAPKPAAPLPPAPKTKAVVLTPQAPYRIDDVIEAEMKEMEDLEGEMRREIEARRGR